MKVHGAADAPGAPSDEAGSDEMCAQLLGKTVADLLESDEVTTRRLPNVLPEDTLVEIATVMIDSHCPVVVVRDRQGRYSGVVTFARTMAAMADAAQAGAQKPGKQP